MKAKKKLKKSSIKKYANGTQVLGNTDPTTMYSTNRDKSVADNEFNNAQQAELNKGVLKQQYQDQTNQALGAYGNSQAAKKGTDAGITSAIGSIPGVGTIAAAGYGLGTQAGDSFNQKSYENTLATGKSDTGNKLLGSVLTPTSSKLMNAKTGTDVLNAFVPFLGLNSTTQAKTEQAALAAKEKQAYVDKQMSQFGAIDSTVQNAQLKKGTKKLKARVIETEGPEPIFSPKDSSGERELLYHDPNGPTHKEGGVKAAVVKSGRNKIRGMLTIPEGSAIVTRDEGMNQKALKAYKEGDKNKLNKIINQMPSDTNSKKADGTNSVNPADKWAIANQLNQPNPSDKWAGYTPPNVEMEQPVPLSSVSTTSKKTYNSSSLKNVGTGLLQAAPSLYNLGRGLFEKAKTTNRRYINNEGYKYQDLSNPNRRAVNEQFRVESNNIKNATGGSGGAYLANQNLAATNRFKNMSDINNQEAGRRLDIANTNTGLKNQQNAQNIQLANQYDDLDTQNIARKNDFIGAGLTGLSDLSFNKELMKNQANADRIRATTLETTNFKYDPEKEQRLFKTYKKGNKSLKYKKK